MSAETDIALMVELEEKIDQRIRDGVYKAINGDTRSFPSTFPVSDAMLQSAVAGSVKTYILNDNVFLTELAKRIGQRMQYLQY